MTKNNTSKPIINTVVSKKKEKREHPQLYTYKIVQPNGESFETVTSKQSGKNREQENILRLEMAQKDHPAWTGDIFGRVVSTRQTSRTKNTSLDIFSI